MRKWYTVKDMFDYAIANELPLLSTYKALGDKDFWAEYRTNHIIYDKLFTNFYKNFRYYDQDIEADPEETIDEVTLHFIQAVYSWLLINQKKYEELKRVNDIALTDNLLEDVDYTRTETATGQESGANIYGSRTDTNNTTSGQRQDTLTEQVSPFESSDYQNSSKNTTNKGQQLDTELITKGQETDTSSLNKQDNKTVTVQGKMGAESKDLLIAKHLQVWDKYKYYIAIFNDIAKEFLLT